MPKELSPRLGEIVDALPFTPGSRVLEIGCGPGAAARTALARIAAATTPDGRLFVDGGRPLREVEITARR